VPSLSPHARPPTRAPLPPSRCVHELAFNVGAGEAPRPPPAEHLPSSIPSHLSVPVACLLGFPSSTPRRRSRPPDLDLCDPAGEFLFFEFLPHFAPPTPACSCSPGRNPPGKAISVATAGVPRRRSEEQIPR
jgi:hypothetical protein